jgi:hypothetical protein
MELLRRALLVGCALPALWLFRLATLDPLVAIEPASQAEQGPSGGSDAVSVSGPEWARFLREVDILQQGDLGPPDRWRLSPDVPQAGGNGRWVYFKPDELPSRALPTELGAGGGAGLVSLSRPGGVALYRVYQRSFTRQEFTPGTGFTGKPAPPSSLLYPFQYVAYVCFFVGIALFALIPSPTKERGGLSPGELALGVAALGLFAAPLLATGGSVQALTRGLAITIPCWILAGIAIHFFAKPGLNAPHPLFERTGATAGTVRVQAANVPTFMRWGVVMLAVATGPLAVLVAVSMTFWNR